jgi:hypothetical protein
MLVDNPAAGQTGHPGVAVGLMAAKVQRHLVERNGLDLGPVSVGNEAEPEDTAFEGRRDQGGHSIPRGAAMLTPIPDSAPEEKQKAPEHPQGPSSA